MKHYHCCFCCCFRYQYFSGINKFFTTLILSKYVTFSYNNNFHLLNTQHGGHSFTCVILFNYQQSILQMSKLSVRKVKKSFNSGSYLWMQSPCSCLPCCLQGWWSQLTKRQPQGLDHSLNLKSTTTSSSRSVQIRDSYCVDSVTELVNDNQRTVWSLVSALTWSSASCSYHCLLTNCRLIVEIIL